MQHQRLTGAEKVHQHTRSAVDVQASVHSTPAPQPVREDLGAAETQLELLVVGYRMASTWSDRIWSAAFPFRRAACTVETGLAGR